MKENNISEKMNTFQKVLDEASHKKLSIKLLNVDDQNHCLSFGRDPEPLVLSIRHVGLLQPITVCPDDNDRYSIVSGFRRVEALTRLRETLIPCNVLPHALTPLEKLHISFWENLSHRGFHLVEKALAVNRYLSLLKPEDVQSTILPALGLHPHGRDLQRMTTIAGLPENVLNALVENRIFPDPALFLLEFPLEDRNPIFEFLMSLHGNLNTQKELLGLLLDISLRDGTDATEILASEDLQAILDHPQLSRPQKTDRVKKALKQRLYPRLTAAENAFAEALAGLRVPKSVRISHDPYFETAGLRIGLQVGDSKAFEDALNALQQDEERKRIEQLFNICRGQ